MEAGGFGGPKNPEQQIFFAARPGAHWRVPKSPTVQMSEAVAGVVRS